MKVIYTGYSKCGTKSMAEALRELGLTVYDFMENYEFLGDEWTKICKYGGTREDFRRMFENVDAVTDMPCYMFWEEILDAFPDAKIIHCERPSEDQWYVSFHRQMVVADVFIEKLFARLSPTWWHFYAYCQLMTAAVWGSPLQEGLFRSTHVNELICRKGYRCHNTYLRKHAPEDQLLIWKLGDGWKPICQFLNLPVPNKPFPHNNKKASLWDDIKKTNKTLQRMGVEIAVALLVLTSLSAFGAYKVHQGPGWMWVLGLPKLAFKSIQSWIGL